MENKGSSGLETDVKGSLDVDAELQSIHNFKNLGMDTEGMEDLLFTDISQYKKKKMELLRQEIHNSGLTSGEIENEEFFEDNPHEDIYADNDLTIEEPNIGDLDDDLLLLDIPNNEKSIPQDPIPAELNMANDAPTDVGESIVPVDNDLPSIIENDQEIQFEEESETVPQEIVSDEEYEHRVPHMKIKGNKGLLIGSISIMVIIILVGTYIGYSMIDNGSLDEDEFDPVINISDINPSAGNIVNIEGFPQNIEGLKYNWTIFPSYYNVITGSLDENKFTLFFKRPTSFDINLKVTSGSNTKTASINIEAQSTDITLERERLGDSAEYDIEGNVRLDHIDRMVNSKDLRVYKTLYTDFWTTEANPMIASISTNIIDSRDGFGDSYSHIQRSTTEVLKMSGYLQTDAGTRSPLTGTTSLDQQSFVDLYNKRPTSMVSDVEYDLSVQTVGGSFDYITSEKIWTYPSLSNSFSELSIEDISPQRNIAYGDSGTTLWGSYDLNWNVVEYDMILGIPSLKLDLSLDSQTMTRLSLNVMEMSIWIGDGYPQIMKMILYIESARNVQTPYVLDYSQSMTSYENGDTAIIFGDIQYQHPSKGRINEIDSKYGVEFHSNWDMVPMMGSMFSSIPDDFTAEDALDKFTDNPNYKNFERTKSDPFALISNFTIKLDTEQWKFSIGDTGDDRCWNQTVIRETITPGLASRINPVMVTKDDIGEILTYSAGEAALKELLSTVNENGAKAIFGVSNIPIDSKVDLERYSIGTMADMPHPVIGFVNPTLGEKIDYGMFISSADGKIEVALDMTSGQLSYVRITI